MVIRIDLLLTAVGGLISAAGLAPALAFVSQPSSMHHVSWKANRRRTYHCAAAPPVVAPLDRRRRKSKLVALAQSVNLEADQQEDGAADINTDNNSSSNERRQTGQIGGSYIESIKSYNVAGMVNNDGNKEVVIHLGDEPNLIAVTGETGSGKSVLIARVAALVTGGTASPTMLPPGNDGETSSSTQEAVVEMTIHLTEPHISMVELTCKRIGINSSTILRQHDADNNSGRKAKLVLRRTLSLQPSMTTSSNNKKRRLKSTCEINGQTITLKAIKAIAGPLLTIVDAAAAAAALSRPNARLAVVDTAVPISIKADALRAKTAYRQARRHREALERDLNSQVLPPTYSHSDDPTEEAIEMLRHWVDELDVFEKRMIKFRDSAVSPGGSSISIDSDTSPVGSSELAETIQRFEAASWFDSVNEQTGGAVSEFYSQLLDFRELVKDVDAQLQAANSARDALSALSLPDSAITALERARNHLFDATGEKAGNAEDDGKSQDSFSVAAEDAHDRLNVAEDALSDCVKSLEDPSKGLIVTLERMVGSIGVSLEEIDAVIADWNTMSRKHAISPFSLPSCHRALRSELDGSVEARTLLPKAKAAEKDALKDFEYACAELSAARQDLCSRLSEAVSKRLPSLGIQSQFEARLNASVQQCTDSAAYGEGSGLGIDSVDFMLRHQPSDSSDGSSSGDEKGRGGKLETIGSAGEKARILLAIETEFPGSVGVLCGRDASSLEGGSDFTETSSAAKSVAVIYDEIDAHVGGRAAVALAKLLVDQTRPQLQDDDLINGGGQVICITHSPSVAAVADRHVVIQKPKSSAVQEQDANRVTTNPVLAVLVDGESREEELGRMCGGDLARNEAVQFAAALLRDGELQKKP